MSWEFKVFSPSGSVLAESTESIPSMKEAKQVGRLYLRDRRTPKGSRLVVQKRGSDDFGFDMFSLPGGSLF